MFFEWQHFVDKKASHSNKNNVLNSNFFNAKLKNAILSPFGVILLISFFNCVWFGHQKATNQWWFVFTLFWCKTKKFKTDPQCNCVLWTFRVTMTILGHIDISVSLTTQWHLKKKISLQLEQKTPQVSAWWRTKNNQKQKKQATTQLGNSVQPGKKFFWT